MISWKELKEQNIEVVEVLDKVKYTRSTLNVKQIRMLFKNNKISFDNAMQRGKVWDNAKSSYLIDSILRNIPIYPVGAINNEDVLDILDGKQRLAKAVIDFTLGEYALEKCKPILMSLGNGEEDEVDLNGAKFNDLPEHLRDVIDACNFDVVILDEDTTDDIVADIFFRWNNGKPLSAVELTRVKAKSQSKIMEMAKHELFTGTMTAKALESYKNEDIVIKTYFMLNEKEPDLETKHLRKEIVNTDITDNDVEQITGIYDRIIAMRKAAFKRLKNDQEAGFTEKAAERTANKIVSKTHMLSMIPYINKTINEGLSVDEATDWFIGFFGIKKGGSKSALYNEAARGSSARKTSIAKRDKELKKHYDAWYKRLMANRVKPAQSPDDSDKTKNVDDSFENVTLEEKKTA